MILTAPDDLFDRRHYLDVRRPLLEASSLPAWCYTSQRFYDREVDKVFGSNWNFVGREDEIETSGDYLTYDLCGESVIVLRDDAHRIRAFANSCRHRGTRLLNDAGRCRVISCPYHSWAYALDGRLIGTPGMEQSANFDPADNGLIALPVDTWDGFVFVNLGNANVSLKDYLGDLPEKFSSYNFGDVRCVRRKTFDVACNWKLYVENALEDYHTATVHRGSIGNQDTYREDTAGAWDAIHMESPDTIAVLPQDNSPFPRIGGLAGKPAAGTFFTVIYPSTFFASTQDCMWWIQQLPQGPQHTRVVVGSCFPSSTVARDDFEEVVKRYYVRWDKSIPEDNDICEQQQVGLRSRFGRPGRLSWREPIVHAIDNWILDQVLD